MSFTFIQALWSIVVMITFLGIVFWAYSRKRKDDFDEAARVPFEDESEHQETRSGAENKNG